MSPAHLIMKSLVLPYGLCFRERRAGAVILVYHRVGGGTGSDIDLPAAAFERQMAYLRTHGRVAALDVAPPAPSAGDVTMVTFDDGAREVYEQAYPILLRHRIPAVVYVVTDYVERGRPFDFGLYRRATRRAEPLRWTHLREMVGSGLVQVGSHTHTHPDLTRLSPREAEEELRRSRDLIAERLGTAPVHFAYPWGRVTPGVRDLVGRFYRTAVRGGSAKNVYGGWDALALWRRPVQQSDAFWLFRLKLASYLDGEEALRAAAARLRAAAGTG